MGQPEHAEITNNHIEEGFNAGEVIIEHVANSPLDHPIFHLPSVFGIDLSVTKHVLMLWIVASIVGIVVTTSTRRYLKTRTPNPKWIYQWT